jgi:hypothetical protein
MRKISGLCNLLYKKNEKKLKKNKKHLKSTHKIKRTTPFGPFPFVLILSFRDVGPRGAKFTGLDQHVRH